VSTKTRRLGQTGAKSRSAVLSPLPGLLGRESHSGSSKVSEHVYQMMKEEIVVGILRPGESVTENELAARYKASRTPVREAAARLQHQGLLQIVPNRGYFISQLTIRALREIYEYRAAVECACAELAASIGGPPAAFDELDQHVRQQRRVDTRATYARFIKDDTAFHVGVARLAQNQLLVRAVADMRCHMERILFAAIDVVDKSYYQELPANEHAQILQAIRRRDHQLARKLMYDHIMLAKNPVIEQASRGSGLL
jgi:DNA-binding GntR family transcriptional regulator